jgi:hypothetical protein
MLIKKENIYYYLHHLQHGNSIRHQLAKHNWQQCLRQLKKYQQILLLTQN